jgi:hypothetical protein
MSSFAPVSRNGYPREYYHFEAACFFLEYQTRSLNANSRSHRPDKQKHSRFINSHVVLFAALSDASCNHVTHCCIRPWPSLCTVRRKHLQRFEGMNWVILAPCIVTTEAGGEMRVQSSD